MGRWTRHGFAIGIIVVGFCVASQFRTSQPLVETANDVSSPIPESAAHSDITLQISTSTSDAPAWQAAVTKTESDADAEKQPAPRPTLSGLEPPPGLADTFESWAIESEAGGPRRHTIEDGDTLQSLAGRYLGDPKRWQEILDANPGTLAAELLPLKTEIVIPDRETKPSRSTPAINEDDLVPVDNPL